MKNWEDWEDDAGFYAAMACPVIRDYNDDEYDEYDEEEVINNTPSRGRAYRRKMFFKKEKYTKEQEFRRRGYVRNEQFLRKHIPEVFDDGFQGISNHEYSISVLEKEDGKMLILVENHINQTKSIYWFSYIKGEIEATSWWKPLRKISQNDFQPVYYKRFYPNVKGFKRIANKKVRRYKVFDEDGTDVSFSSKGSGYRKVFDSYDICEY